MNESDYVGTTFTREFLETLPETDLRQAESTLNKHINALRAKSRKTYEFEVELCYVQDELNRREAMAAASAAWAEKNGNRFA